MSDENGTQKYTLSIATPPRAQYSKSPMLVVRANTEEGLVEAIADLFDAEDPEGLARSLIGVFQHEAEATIASAVTLTLAATEAGVRSEAEATPAPAPEAKKWQKATPADGPAPTAVIGKVWAISKSLGMDRNDVAEFAMQQLNLDKPPFIKGLTTQQADVVITALKELEAN